MRNCHAVINGGGDVTYALNELIKMRIEYPSRFLSRINIFSNIERSYLRGMDDAIDIVTCIKARFETGRGHPEKFFVRSILGIVDEV